MTSDNFSFRLIAGRLRYMRVSIKNGTLDAATLPQGVRNEIDLFEKMVRKDRFDAFCEEYGLPYPDQSLHADAISAFEVARAEGREAFVLKPINGANSNGVFILYQRDPLTYWCTNHRQSYSLDRLRESLTNSWSEPFILNEMIKDISGNEAPHDFKVYAFKTGCPLMLASRSARKARNYKPNFSYFDRQGTNIGNVSDLIGAQTQKASDDPPPKGWESAFELAEVVMKKVPVSFIRVDMLMSSRGPVVCELTASPAQIDALLEPWDTKLGALWTKSQQELGFTYPDLKGTDTFIAEHWARKRGDQRRQRTRKLRSKLVAPLRIIKRVLR